MRTMFALGVTSMTPNLIDRTRPPRKTVDRDGPLALGEYLARVADSQICTPAT